MIDILTFGGKSLSDFNTYWDGSKVFVKPVKQYNKYDVPGRNGSLTRSQKAFGNVTISFSCFIRRDFKKYYSQLVDYLNSLDGYQRLETTTEPDVFRMAVFHSAVTPTTGSWNHSGKFTIEFDCMPQQFLKSGEVPVEILPNKEFILKNPAYQSAKPMIKVTGTGQFSVNGQTVIVSSNPGTVYIDSELMDSYAIVSGAYVNMNPYVVVPEGYVLLRQGENVIATDSITVEITPRWFRI